MIIPDKKKATTIILSRLKSGTPQNMPVKPETDAHEKPEDEPLAIAAQDLLQAINDKSVMGVKEALRSFMDLIQSDDEKLDAESEK